MPLAEIASWRAQGIPLAPIRTAVRTGDTPTAERQQMTKQPPHILVTTPESLFILLTAERPREMLRTVRTVIVDEIHAVADDKRGSHLALSLARLEALAGRAPAAHRPLRDREADRRSGAVSESTRAHIVNVGHRRDMDLAVEVPRDELGPVASNEMWARDLRPPGRTDREHRTTLVFVNTRRLAERVAHHLGERLGEGHGAAASRQPLAAAAAGSRAAAEERRTARGGGHGVARTRHRHRHGGSGVPDRLAAVDRGGAAAHRPRRPLGGRDSRKAASSPPRATS